MLSDTHVVWVGQPRGCGLDSGMDAIRSQLRALANDRNLRRFVVQARPTGRQLGTGSYGAVEEVWK